MCFWLVRQMIWRRCVFLVGYAHILMDMWMENYLGLVKEYIYIYFNIDILRDFSDGNLVALVTGVKYGINSSFGKCLLVD